MLFEPTSIQIEGFGVFCDSKTPCHECVDVFKNNFFCSCCDVPSRVKYIADGNKLITNNTLHSCEGCGHTAHWTCHRGKSLMDPVDVMSMSKIRCVKCKTMIVAKHTSVFREVLDTTCPMVDIVFIRNLFATITESSNMKAGHFKTTKTGTAFDYIITNIRTFDRIKNARLENVLTTKLNEFAKTWGSEKSGYYFDKIM